MSGDLDDLSMRVRDELRAVRRQGTTRGSGSASCATKKSTSSTGERTRGRRPLSRRAAMTAGRADVLGGAFDLAMAKAVPTIPNEPGLQFEPKRPPEALTAEGAGVAGRAVRDAAREQDG